MSRVEFEAGSFPPQRQREDTPEDLKEGTVFGRTKMKGGHPDRNTFEDRLSEVPATVDRIPELERVGNVRIRPQ